MSKLSNRIANLESPEVNNFVTMRDIPYSPLPVNSILKDAIIDEKFELNSLNKLKKKKPNYMQSNTKQTTNKEKQKKKKKRVRFKYEFVDEVLIESYKEHNLKMCFMQGEIEEIIYKEKRDCRECLEKYCLTF
jgi:hypothetical protein